MRIASRAIRMLVADRVASRSTRHSRDDRGRRGRLHADESANNDTGFGGCTAGDPGVDTIELMTDVVLDQVHNETLGPTGLPVVSSDITIEGGGRAIRRSDELFGPEFRIFAVRLGAEDTTLTLRNTTVSGGRLAIENYLANNDGAGIFLDYGTSLHLQDSAVIENTARENGSGGGIWGGVFSTITVEGSTIGQNQAAGFGGGIFLDDGSILTMDQSRVEANSLVDIGFPPPSIGAGGGISMNRLSTVVITNSSIVSNMAFLSDYAQGSGGGISFGGESLTIADSIFAGNISAGGGGISIARDSAAVISNTTVSSNRTRSGNYGFDVQLGRGGGGIRVYGELIMSDSIVSGNVDDEGLGGGGIRAASTGRITLTNTTFVGNQSIGDLAGLKRGAGLLVEDESDVTLINSTVSGNTADFYGGAIYVDDDAQLTVIHSTLFGNTAGDGGGNIYNETGTVRVLSSVLAEGACVGLINDGEDNFTDSVGCPGTPIVGGVDIDQMLADNGGPTPTHALVRGSVAIDGGIDCPLDTDQRGFARDDGLCDSGSFEFGGGALPLTLTATGDCPGTLTVSLSGATPGGSVRLFRSIAEGMFTLPAGGLCEGVVLDLEDPQTVATNVAGAEGEFSATFMVSDAACGLYLQAIDATTCAVSEVIELP